MALLEKLAGSLIFRGGKYDGRTAREIAQIDPGYLQWLVKKGPAEHLSDDIFGELDAIMREFKVPMSGRRR
jgi:hypothetical protein